MGARGHIQLALDGTCTGEDARHLAAALERLDDMRTLLDQLFAYARANDPDRRPEIETIAVHPLLAEILLGPLSRIRGSAGGSLRSDSGTNP